jgi:cytochrome c oxidase cbb3-type subunit 3/ubiquinol-cytochrome c reductase cytochrome c subunit
MQFTLAILSLAVLSAVGCKAPGKPGPAEERPEEVKDFNALYKQNCAACHGEQGRGGIAISMANPVYIAVAGQQPIAKAIAEGGPGDLMPAFGKKYGGFLTDEQVNILAYGIVQRWGNPRALGGATAPAYAATLTGDVANGKAAFNSFCVRCHQDTANPNPKLRNVGPITDPDFLALISDQNLRSTILTGKPDEGMPDWRGYAAQPLSDQQVTDLVAWLASQRRTNGAKPASLPTSTPQGEQK